MHDAEPKIGHGSQLLGEGGSGQQIMLGMNGHGQQMPLAELKQHCVSNIVGHITELGSVVRALQDNLDEDSSVVPHAVQSLRKVKKLGLAINECAPVLKRTETNTEYNVQSCHEGLANASVDTMQVFQQVKNVDPDNQFAMLSEVGKILPILKSTQKLSGVCGITKKGCVNDLVTLGLSILKVEQELQTAISTMDVESLVSAVGDLVALYPLAKTVASECEGDSDVMIVEPTARTVPEIEDDEDCVRSIQALVLDGESTVLEIAEAVKSGDTKAVQDILSKGIPKLASDVAGVMDNCNEE